MKKKGCDLCNGQARMYCDSDQASLCWDCDEKVHGANFLVAKHNRTVLCHVCQSPTPWQASGSNLGRTISICFTCVSRSRNCNNHNNCKVQLKMGEASTSDSAEGSGEVDQVHRLTARVQVPVDEVGDWEEESHQDEVDNDDYEDKEDGDENMYSGDSEEDEEDEVDEDENQVVPWSSTPPPLPVTATSSSEDDEKEVENSFDFRNPKDYFISGAVAGDRVFSPIKRIQPITFLYSTFDESERTSTATSTTTSRNEEEEFAASIDEDEEENLRNLRTFKRQRLLTTNQ